MWWLSWSRQISPPRTFAHSHILSCHNHTYHINIRVPIFDESILVMSVKYYWLSGLMRWVLAHHIPISSPYYAPTPIPRIYISHFASYYSCCPPIRPYPASLFITISPTTDSDCISTICYWWCNGMSPPINCVILCIIILWWINHISINKLKFFED